MAYQNRCAHCANLYEAERSTSRFCCDAHRTAYNREIETRRVEQVSALLRQTSEAISNAAPRAVLEALAVDAKRLLEAAR